MRLLGLDVGNKNIGIAVSDEDKKIAVPLDVIDNSEEAGLKLKEITERYDIGKIVVGVPYTLMGEVGRQAKKVLDFVDRVVKKLGIDVDYIDERFTTRIPLEEFQKHSKYRKIKKIDKFSAGIILDDYLKKNRGN
ncbi:MAG: Holliday junction resolvase RuvX [Actinomycetota bacterium]|nr:Holliday junction resolvase RuvX [Actinomycetota bacterium]